MADKRRVKKSIKQLQRVKTWQLLVLLVLLGFVTATFLRLNNIGMIQRRDALLAADKAGDQTAMTNRLYDLQRYVAAHANTNTGPFYLEHQYQRDTQKIVDAAKEANSSDNNINAIVDELCRSRFSSYSQAWVQCFTDELAKYPPAENPVDSVSLPSTDLYRYNFASPLWSPDFAGWSMLASGVIVLMIIARLVSLGILHLLLKQRYKGI